MTARTMTAPRMAAPKLSWAIAAGVLCFALVGCGSSGEGSGVTESGDGTDASTETTSTTAADNTTTERSIVTIADAEMEDQQALPQTFGVDAIIRFQTGGTSATVSDAVVLGQRNRYTLEAAAGQTMMLGLVSLEDNAVFDLYGPGDVLLAAEGTTASIVLPSDGDYTIIVGGTRGNATYDLTVEIP